jgi:plastocyanin
MRSLPIAALAMLSLGTSAMSPQAPLSSDVRAQLSLAKPSERHHAPAAVLWLKPLQETPAAPFASSQTYTLLQKNRTFKPHLLVVPVGGVVQFPNADPFFHNVFSLFDGKRFDLGLYEAGSTKSVTFSREGVSYIFCNIHPEMSAVILALSTRLYATADPSGRFHLVEVPAGEYELHVWVEGIQQPALNALTRRIHLTASAADLGKVEVPGGIPPATTHTNMYGKPYDRETRPAY